MKKELTFEESVQRLEEIVRGMERGDVSLDECLKLFQEGTELVAGCNQLLDEAQMQIAKIVPSAEGTPAEEVFADE